MAFPVAAVIGGVGALASMFGKKPKPSAYENAQAELVKQQSGIVGQLQGYAGAARKRYDGLQPRRDGALNGYSAMLSQNPYTDTFRAQRIGNMTAQTNGAYDAARTSTLVDAARSGVSPDSSGVQGRLGAADAARAADKSRAYLTLTQEELSDRERRMRDLYSLFSGEANEARGDSQNLLGQGMNGMANVSGQYGNLAQVTDNRNANFDNQRSEIMAKLAQMFGGMFASGDTKKAKV